MFVYLFQLVRSIDSVRQEKRDESLAATSYSGSGTWNEWTGAFSYPEQFPRALPHK